MFDVQVFCYSQFCPFVGAKCNYLYEGTLVIFSKPEVCCISHYISEILGLEKGFETFIFSIFQENKIVLVYVVVVMSLFPIYALSDSKRNDKINKIF